MRVPKHVLDVRPCLLVCSKSIVLVSGVLRAIIAYDSIVIIGPDAVNPLVSDEESDEMLQTIQRLLKELEFGGLKGRDYFEFRYLLVRFGIFVHS